jgi:hypothetical protein
MRIKNNLHRNTYPLVTIHSKVFLEALTFLQLDKQYPALYETPKFITIAISACCFRILGQINPLHNFPPYSFMIHFTVPLPSAFTTKTVYSHLPPPHTFLDLSPEYLVRMHAIFICQCQSHISELCHNFRRFISLLNFVILFCTLFTRYARAWMSLYSLRVQQPYKCLYPLTCTTFKKKSGFTSQNFKLLTNF